MPEARKSYPRDVSDEKGSFVTPYLTLMREDAARRTRRLREVFNALRWLVRAGAPWRMMPTPAKSRPPPRLEVFAWK